MQIPMLRPAWVVALLLSASVAAQARQFTDSADRNVTVPIKIERVYAAGPPASIMLLALAPEKLIGWTRAIRPDEAQFLPRRYTALPELGRLTGRGNTANVEVVLAADPDVIIDAGSLAPTFVSLADRVHAQTGIPYLLFDGSFAATPNTFRALGRLLGEEERAETLALYIEKTLANIERETAAVPPEKRPRVYYARSPSGLQTALSGSINVEVLDALNAINVAGKTDFTSGLASVSLEQVLFWNPEVIVTSDVQFFNRIGFDSRWNGIEAVRNGKVYLSPHLPFGWFDFPPGPNRIIGLQWLARILYPDLFPGDIRERAKEFYRLFYHHELPDAQLDVLLPERKK